MTLDSEASSASGTDHDPDPVDWKVLLNEFHHRQIDGIYNAVLKCGLIPDLDLLKHGASKSGPDEDFRDADNVATALAKKDPWAQAFKNPGQTRLLAYFIFVWGMWTWERTSHYRKIAEVVAEAGRAYWCAKDNAKKDSKNNAACFNLSPGEESICDIIVGRLTTPKPAPRANRHTQSERKYPPISGALLLDCVGVEVALNNASAQAMKECSKAVADCAREVLHGNEINSATSVDGLRDLLHAVLVFHDMYYSALEKVADVFLAAGDDVATPPAGLEQAIQDLKSCESSLKGDVSASELRTHRYALQALGQRLKDTSRPQLKLKSVKIIYVYPFTIPGLNGKDICAEIAAFRNNDLAAASPQLKLAGTTPRPAHEAPWTDLWTWRGPSEDSMSGSVGLPMPPLSVQLQGDEDPVDGYDVALRFNNLGNHYVRIEKELHDPTLTQITQSLRRAFQAIGREKITFSGGTQWDSVVEYMDEVISDMLAWFSQSEQFKKSMEEGESSVPVPLKDLINLDLDHHTLIEIRAASIRYPGDGWRDATGDEIRLIAGPALMQPVNPVATTLHEWICREPVDSTANMLDYKSFMCDFVIGTGSRTVLCTLSSPDWLHSGYSEVAEFVASLPALLRLWMHQLDKVTHDAGKLLDINPDDFKVNDHDWKQHEYELRNMRFRLHEKVEEVRKYLMYLSPSELVGSPFWSSQKALLARLYALPTITDLTADIEARLNRADASLERMAARQTRLYDQSIQNDQNRLQVMLLLVSLFSFAGFMTLVLEVVYGSSVPQMTSDNVPAVVVVIAYFAVSIPAAIYAARMLTGRARSRERDHAPGRNQDVNGDQPG